MRAKYHLSAGLRNRDFSWHHLSACRNADPDIFFAESYDPALNRARVNQAREICSTCPVKRQCLKQALDNRENSYVWGGKTSDERRAILRRQQRERLL